MRPAIIHYCMMWCRKELSEVQDQINYGHHVEERLKEELKELNGNN